MERGVGGGREREEGKRPMKLNVWGTGEHFECSEVGEKFDWWTGKFPSMVSLVVVLCSMYS